MKKWNGYETTQVMGGKKKLPVGAYVCNVLEAREESYGWGSVLVIHFDIAERMLSNYPNLKIKVENLKIELEQAQEVVGIRGASDNEKAGSNTYAFSSIVENEVIERDRNLEKTVQTILREMLWREREIRKVENAMSRLNEEERKLIECRYFKGLSINRSCELLDITPATFNRKRKKIIENTLIPLL